MTWRYVVWLLLSLPVVEQLIFFFIHRPRKLLSQSLRVTLLDGSTKSQCIWMIWIVCWVLKRIVCILVSVYDHRRWIFLWGTSVHYHTLLIRTNRTCVLLQSRRVLFVDLLLWRIHLLWRWFLNNRHLLRSAQTIPIRSVNISQFLHQFLIQTLILPTQFLTPPQSINLHL